VRDIISPDGTELGWLLMALGVGVLILIAMW
jgi:hypothetical protein